MPVRIKICGITNIEDAVRAAELGADMIGLNFFAKSPRCIDAEIARAIVRSLPKTVEAVGLFVHEPLPVAQSAALSLGIGSVQIHTDHRDVLPAGTRWIPAFGVGEVNDLNAITAYLALLDSVGAAPHAILVDARVQGMHGGTGQVAPWRLLANFQPGVPLILAGGLTPENVAEAIRIVKPWAVDVASGVESAAGKKNDDKMRHFIDAVRAAQ